MSKYVCESAELVQEQGKNPYLRCTFKKQAANILMQSAGKPVVLAMSGGFFTNNKPDVQKNLAWCQQMAPQFVNQEASIDEFTVESEPYYRIIDNKIERDSAGEPIIHNQITVRTFSEFDAATSVVSPLSGWDSVKRQGKRMLENGSAMYITVAKYQQQLAAKQAAQQVQSTANPFASAAASGVVDSLPM